MEKKRKHSRHKVHKFELDRFFKVFVKNAKRVDIPFYFSTRHRHHGSTLEALPKKVPFWFLLLACFLLFILVVIAFLIGHQKGLEVGLRLHPFGFERIVEEKRVGPSFELCLPYSNLTVYKAITLSLRKCHDFYNSRIPEIPTFNTVYNELVINKVSSNQTR